jgi:hypothetical protein
VRSVSTTGTNGAYFSKGIFFGVTFWGGIVSPGVGELVSVSWCRVVGRVGDRAGKSKNPPAGGAGGAGERGYVALAIQKQKEVAAQHRRQH